MAVELLQPSVEHLHAYEAALARGWSPDNLRPREAAEDERRSIAQDPALFVARQVDREARGGPVTLPDGTRAPRLPGYRLWIWDGEFCGTIGLRWRPGTPELPPHVSGHIGYGVVPWKRGRGLATAALGALLPRARAEGLPWVTLTTDPGNGASRRVIEANGGVLLGRYARPAALGGTEGLRYRIDLAPAGALFATEALVVEELRVAAMGELQRFYEANPDYDRRATGAAPGPEAARELLAAYPPPEWPLGRKWVLAARDGEGRIAAVMDILEDLFAPGVWCVGFFMVAERLHGSGEAARLHEALLAWMRSRGARWSRLGVVDANVRAARFWRSRGYRELRLRHDYPVGPRRHTLHVLARALHDDPDWEAYRRLVPRDDPAQP